MVPSGYKEDTVYSVVPSDGSGDLSFTRASNGTRVNSSGLVEVCPWNLLEYSEDFSNAVWNKYQSAITANAISAPNGTTTADKLEYTTTGTAVLFATSSALQNQVYTLSCYGKKGTTNIIQIGFTLSGGDKIANFNLNTGVITTTSSGVNASIESVGNGWYRCIMSLTTDINTPNIFINSTSGTTGEYIYIWGAQLNIGSTAKPYFPTTDRLNVPRLTYQNGGGGCPSLLLEKQSTNIAAYSEDATQWLLGSIAGTITVTANQTTSPDGTQNADKIQFPAVASSGAYAVSYYEFTASATNYSGNFYLKGNSGGEVVYIMYTPDGTNYTSVACTLTTEWQRFNITSNLSAGTQYFQIGVDLRDSTQTAKNAQTIYVWGRQLEASSYPTSYIPTTSSSATRVADACYKTGISSLIGQTEGVIFADITPQIFNDSAYQTVAIIYPSYGLSGATYFHFYKNTGSKTLFFEVWNATSQCSLSYTMANNTRYKVAAGYKNNDFVLYVNGVQVGSDTSGTIGAVSYSTLEMGYDSFNTDSQMSLSEFVLFQTRLTNAELASLTTI